MRYVFACANQHSAEVVDRRAPQDHECPDCGIVGRRDFPAEFATQLVISDDPFRKSYLSSRIDHNLAEQGRPLDPLAPKDRFDLKRIEQNTGRVYIGDDVSKLSAKAQRAILNGERRKGQSLPRL